MLPEHVQIVGYVMPDSIRNSFFNSFKLLGLSGVGHFALHLPLH